MHQYDVPSNIHMAQNYKDYEQWFLNGKQLLIFSELSNNNTKADKAHLT